MEIYTGYYSKMKAYTGMTCVAISLGVPKWIGGSIPNLRPLNPRSDMLKMEQERYIREYNGILARLSPEAIVRYLESVSAGKPVILLCYEKPGEFCHRKLVADWLNRTLGLQVREYGGPETGQPKQAKTGYTQQELF